MTIVDLLNLANKAYCDGILGLEGYYTKTGKFNKRGSGDGLARFIVQELIETFDPTASTSAQLGEAARAMESAKDQLDNLQFELEKASNAN